ncbi:NHL repeat-containing protein [Candidatus Woesearchaeota archaeon]|nr:NHL repeat-containing protein [Candidatus Woesearchaeota archaeon]
MKDKLTAKHFFDLERRNKQLLALAQANTLCDELAALLPEPNLPQNYKAGETVFHDGPTVLLTEANPGQHMSVESLRTAAEKLQELHGLAASYTGTPLESEVRKLGTRFEEEVAHEKRTLRDIERQALRPVGRSPIKPNWELQASKPPTLGEIFRDVWTYMKKSWHEAWKPGTTSPDVKRTLEPLEHQLDQKIDAYFVNLDNNPKAVKIRTQIQTIGKWVGAGALALAFCGALYLSIQYLSPVFGWPRLTDYVTYVKPWSKKSNGQVENVVGKSMYTAAIEDAKSPTIHFELVNASLVDPAYSKPEDIRIAPNDNALLASYTEDQHFVLRRLSNTGIEEIFRQEMQSPCTLSGIDRKDIAYIVCDTTGDDDYPITKLNLQTREIVTTFSVRTKVFYDYAKTVQTVTDIEGNTFWSYEIRGGVDRGGDYKLLMKTLLMKTDNQGRWLQSEYVERVQPTLDITTMHGNSIARLTPSDITFYDDKFARTHEFGRQGMKIGEFNQPQSIAMDSRGNVYIADTSNHRVQIYDPERKVVYQIGQYGAEPGRFDNPTRVAVDSRGNLYVVDSGNNRIQHFHVTLPKDT